MKIFYLSIVLIGLTSCEGYFFLSGSADSGPVSLSSLLGQVSDSESNSSPIVGSLAINLAAALEAKGIEETKINHILQAAALASQDSKNAVAAAKAFLGGAVGALQTSNEQVQGLALTEDDTTSDLLDLSATIMDSSYKTTGTYLAQHGNTGATNSKVDNALINTAMQGMATETLSKLKTIIPVAKLKDAVKTVMNTTSTNAGSMHNKAELAVSESQDAFKSVMQGIFSATKEIKELKVEDVADAVVATLAVVIKKQNIASKDAATLVIGMSSAIVTTVASDKDMADKSSSVALKVLDVGIQSLTGAGVDKTALAAGISNLVQNVATIAITNAAKSETDLVKQIASAAQKSTAIVANSAGLDVSDLSKAASQATKKAVFAANSSATSDELAAISSQIYEGEKKGLASSNVVNTAILNSIVVNNQNDTAAIIKSVITKPNPTLLPNSVVIIPAPSPSPMTSVSGPINNYMFFLGKDSYSGTNSDLYRTDGTVQGTVMLLSTMGDTTTHRFIPKSGSYFWHQDNKVPIASGRFFFNAWNKSTSNWQLWATDGTTANTSAIMDNVYANEFTIARDLYFFTSAQDSAYGLELSVSNGTINGTKKVISDARRNQFTQISSLVSCNNYLFFLARDLTKNYYGYNMLARTDGTDAGTVYTSLPVNDVPVYNIECAAGSLYVTMASTTTGTDSYSLWRTSDGTSYQSIGDNSWVYTNLTVMGNKILARGQFYDYYYGISDYELSTMLLTDTNPSFQPITFKWSSGRTGVPFDPSSGANPQNLVVLNGVTYFSANHYNFDMAYVNFYLFASNGTEMGTTQVFIDSDQKPLRSYDMKGFNNMVVMRGDDACSGQELYMIRRTSTLGQNTNIERVNINTLATDSMSANINPDCNQEYSYSSYPDYFVEAGGKVYFSATYPTIGTELFVTDGTAAGTHMVIDLNPGPLSGYAYY